MLTVIYSCIPVILHLLVSIDTVSAMFFVTVYSLQTQLN